MGIGLQLVKMIDFPLLLEKIKNNESESLVKKILECAFYQIFLVDTMYPDMVDL